MKYVRFLSELPSQKHFIHEPLVSSTQNERKNETDENDDDWLRFLLADDVFGVFWRETTPKFTRCKIIIEL